MFVNPEFFKRIGLHFYNSLVVKWSTCSWLRGSTAIRCDSSIMMRCWTILICLKNDYPTSTKSSGNASRSTSKYFKNFSETFPWPWNIFKEIMLTIYFSSYSTSWSIMLVISRKKWQMAGPWVKIAFSFWFCHLLSDAGISTPLTFYSHWRKKNLESWLNNYCSVTDQQPKICEKAQS